MEPPQPPAETKSKRQKTHPPQAVPLPYKGRQHPPHQSQVKQKHQRLSTVGLKEGKVQKQRSVRDNWVNFLESRKVAVNKDESCFKVSSREKSTHTAERRNWNITDKILTLVWWSFGKAIRWKRDETSTVMLSTFGPPMQKSVLHTLSLGTKYEPSGLSVRN